MRCHCLLTSATSPIRGSDRKARHQLSAWEIRTMHGHSVNLRAALTCLLPLALAPLGTAGAQSASGAVDNHDAPVVRFDTEPFLKLAPGKNLGEVLAVAVDSK